MKKQTILFIAAATALVGCGHLNKTTAFAMRNLDRTTLNFEEVAVHATRPVGYALLPEGISVEVKVTHSGRVKGENMRVTLRHTRTATGYHFTMDPADAARVRAFQKIGLQWAAEGKGEISDHYFLDVKACKTGEVPHRVTALDVLVQWDVEVGLRPIFHGLPISRLADEESLEQLVNCPDNWDE